MVLRMMSTGLLALWLAAPNAHAQTPAPADRAATADKQAPAKNPVDPAAIKAVKDMGAFLQTLRKFRVSTDASGERVLRDGQKIEHSALADLDVERPNKLHASMRSARAQRELIYDGKVVTLYTPAQKYYSSVEFTGNLGELMSRMETKFKVQIPLSDLFLWGTPAAPLDKIESAMNDGQDFVDDDLCDHYAFRQGKIDWQIWIKTGDKPLPRKVVITNRADEARPQSTSVIDWELQPTFDAAVFKFSPPEGAKKIDLVEAKRK